jgi:putative ABC transport system substrate-binding protein
MYNTGEINSVTTIESAKAYLEKAGLSYKEALSPHLPRAAGGPVACRAGGRFLHPNDSMVQSALPQVAEVAKDAKIPVYGSSAVMVASGAFATITSTTRPSAP